jgi:hypothetical protein
MRDVSQKQENNEPNKYQIFCDMDGVLVDLMDGINDAIYNDAPKDSSTRYIKSQLKAREALSGHPVTDKDTFKENPEFKKPVRTFMFRVMKDNRKFWMNLKWAPEGKQLWDYIKDYNPIILSRPTDLQSVIGKKKWVKDNLNLKGERVQIRYNKTPYAQYQNKIGILIDDFQTNTIPFIDAGGQAILYKNVDEAILELKKYGFNK